MTVLVDDDETLVRMVVVEILEELGYAVLEAEDAPTALRILQARPDIDLLVTDVGSPNGMNGRQLADAVRRHLGSARGGINRWRPIKSRSWPGSLLVSLLLQCHACLTVALKSSS
ncbi:response regulator [Rhizobium grahamii]